MEAQDTQDWTIASLFMAMAVAVRLIVVAVAVAVLVHCCWLLFVCVWQKATMHLPVPPVHSNVLKTVHKNVHLIKQQKEKQLAQQRVTAAKHFLSSL